MDQPFFSVIVPTYARPDKLAACLAALCDLDYARQRFEVLVVDDGSRDPPVAVVAGVRDQIQVELLTPAHGGPAAARNAGAARARGQYLAFTDDDCMPDKNWLVALAQRLAAAPDCLVGGRTENLLTRNPYSAASQALIDYLYAYYNADPDNAVFFASNNVALPADGFRALGGFDATFPLAAAEDRDFCDRWLLQGPMTDSASGPVTDSASGARMVYAPEAVVYHAHALSLQSFWRQQANYGHGAYQFRQRRASRGREQAKIEPLAFYANLVRYPFSRLSGGQALAQAALLFLSQAANAAGYYSERIRKGAPDT